MPIVIWKLCYNTIRCHIESKGLRTRLLKMRDSEIVNTHFDAHSGKTIGWDVDVPLDRVKIAERMLRTTCDHSTSCPEVRVYPPKQPKKGK